MDDEAVVGGTSTSGGGGDDNDGSCPTPSPPSANLRRTDTTLLAPLPELLLSSLSHDASVKP